MTLTWFLRVPELRRAVGLALVLALGAFLLLPLATLLLWAFAEVWRYPAVVPQQYSLRWWDWVFHNGDVGKAVGYSFTTAPVVTLLSAVICLPAAYAFSRLRFFGRRFFFIALLAANAFPKFGLYISIATVFFQLDLMNTFQGVVLIQLINTLVVMTWIPTAGFDAVARELEEAARDAGAGPLRVFWRITLPLAMPAIVVAGILAFLAALDEAQGTLLVGSPKILTMPVLMYVLVANYPEPVGAIFSILLSLPSLILLLLARRFLLAGYLAAGFRGEVAVARLELIDLVKRYGSFYAVRDLTLTVPDDHLLCLLGPSGCGKTTTLRMIGGFVTPDGGDVRIDGASVLGQPPERRPTGMVFQRYTLWPHMDVWQNVAFGLQLRGRPRREIDAAVRAALELVGLPGVERRHSSQLSGGQQQRVALARALVLEPRILLLDEPLSNLDAQLRVRMREEITAIQRRVGITTVFVTHDQEEALSIADRIAVMQSGVVEQLATPSELYARPATLFVATFIGTMNLLEGTVAGGQVTSGPFHFPLPPGAPLTAGAPVVVGVRPEDLAVCAPGGGGAAAEVTQATDLGHYQRISLDVPGAGRLVAFAPKSQEVAPGNCVVSPQRALLYARDRLVGVV